MIWPAARDTRKTANPGHIGRDHPACAHTDGSRRPLGSRPAGADEPELISRLGMRARCTDVSVASIIISIRMLFHRNVVRKVLSADSQRGLRHARTPTGEPGASQRSHRMPGAYSPVDRRTQPTEGAQQTHIGTVPPPPRAVNAFSPHSFGTHRSRYSAASPRDSLTRILLRGNGVEKQDGHRERGTRSHLDERLGVRNFSGIRPLGHLGSWPGYGGHVFDHRSVQ